MPDPTKDEHFPDISSKLAAPTKKSQYEKQKAEAEAKRIREEKETAAALKDFIDDYGGPTSNSSKSRSGMSGRLGEDELDRRGGYMGGKRHHPTRPSAARSGPGSLGPPSAFGNKKRNFEGQQNEAPQGLSRFQKSVSGADNVRAFFQSGEEEEDTGISSKAVEREAPKPTMRLSMLPPQLNEAEIKELIPSWLQVEGFRFERSGESRPTQRPSKAAIVTLGANTPNKDIDKVVNDLRDTYLGWGFFLGISKHLSTTALGSGATHTQSSTTAPFGAAPKAKAPSPPTSRFAPPPEHPPNYHGSRHSEVPMPSEVQVAPPSDIKEIRLIHKTIEKIITHGPEFEALLRKQSDIQRDKDWAWFWNPHSPGGVWYRWQLREILRRINPNDDSPAPIGGSRNWLFLDSEPWCAPESDLQFMTPTEFEELSRDPSFRQAIDMEDEEPRKNAGDSSVPSFLNPLQKSKLVHLLSRLPTTTARLRRSDVARVTEFAISNAAGAEEVVDMVITNIIRPFALPRGQTTDAEDKGIGDETSSCKLIGLYIVSDILLASSSSVVRHCWRYRDLFAGALKSRCVYENLGRLGKEFKWGMMRLQKWKNSVMNILSLWESKSVFSPALQREFLAAFDSAAEKTKKDAGIRIQADEVLAQEAEDRRGSNDVLNDTDDPMEDQPAVSETVETEHQMDIDQDQSTHEAPPRESQPAGTLDQSTALRRGSGEPLSTTTKPGKPVITMSFGPKQTPEAQTEAAAAAATATAKRRPKAADLF